MGVLIVIQDGGVGKEQPTVLFAARFPRSSKKVAPGVVLFVVFHLIMYFETHIFYIFFSDYRYVYLKCEKNETDQSSLFQNYYR